jgi:hypothetical protein
MDSFQGTAYYSGKGNPVKGSRRAQARCLRCG